MTGKTLLSARVSYGLSIALLALPLTFGGSAVRADSETPSWGDMLIDPIVKTLQAVDVRLSSLEATLARFAGTFSSEQIIARELCISDQSGAQTCITKAQLDAVLGTMTRTAAVEPSATAREAAAIVIEPAVAITETKPSAGENASALAEPLDVETTGASAAPAPAATVAQAPAVEDARDEEPAHTQSVSPAPSGDAQVSHPEMDTSVAPSDSE